MRGFLLNPHVCRLVSLAFGWPVCRYVIISEMDRKLHFHSPIGALVSLCNFFLSCFGRFFFHLFWFPVRDVDHSFVYCGFENFKIQGARKVLPFTLIGFHSFLCSDLQRRERILRVHSNPAVVRLLF